MRRFTQRDTPINGHVSAGFEPIKELFQEKMRQFAEIDAQLCIYHGNDRVVDLWISSTHNGSFSADSLVNVFSSGKSLEAIAIAWLHDRGLIEYDKYIANYWPEFSAAGKHNITVADLMRHEAGLAFFDEPINLELLYKENIKNNSLGKTIERQRQDFPDNGSKREYHALTRGWITNEIFRRCDPAGRTIGEFISEEISGPLEADVFVGASEQEIKRQAHTYPLPFSFQLAQGLRPASFGRRIMHSTPYILSLIFKVASRSMKAGRIRRTEPFADLKGLSFANEPDFFKGESPSANALCSARGLAKIASMMANKGVLNDDVFLTPKAWDSLHKAPEEATMSSGIKSRFTQGGVDFFQYSSACISSLDRHIVSGREGFYGWMGLGGSIFQWHPELKLGFAFVPTALHTLDPLNERGKLFQKAAIECASNITA